MYGKWSVQIAQGKAVQIARGPPGIARGTLPELFTAHGPGQLDLRYDVCVCCVSDSLSLSLLIICLNKGGWLLTALLLSFTELDQEVKTLLFLLSGGGFLER